jgi:hypothetical protein
VRANVCKALRRFASDREVAKTGKHHAFNPASRAAKRAGANKALQQNRVIVFSHSSSFGCDLLKAAVLSRRTRTVTVLVNYHHLAGVDSFPLLPKSGRPAWHARRVSRRVGRERYLARSTALVATNPRHSLKRLPEKQPVIECPKAIRQLLADWSPEFRLASLLHPAWRAGQEINFNVSAGLTGRWRVDWLGHA